MKWPHVKYEVAIFTGYGRFDKTQTFFTRRGAERFVRRMERCGVLTSAVKELPS